MAFLHYKGNIGNVKILEIRIFLQQKAEGAQSSQECVPAAELLVLT